MRDRSDFNDALTTLSRLHQEAGEERVAPIPYWKKRCTKRHFKGIHDRFLRDHVFRERMIENYRDEEVCRAWDVLAEQYHHMSEAEYFHYRKNWWIALNKSGNDTQPVRKRSDFKQALPSLKRLHQESGERQLKPVSFWKDQQWHSSSSSSSSSW